MSDSDTAQTTLGTDPSDPSDVADLDTDTPTALRDDLPTVQLPLGRDRPGLSIDGEFYTLFELPDPAGDAYRKYAKQGGNIRIHQCDRCGYLTDADALSATSYDVYECGGCGARLEGSAQHGANETYTRVYGPMVDRDSDRFVDVEAVVPDTDCPNGHGPTFAEVEEEFESGQTYTSDERNEAAVACPQCVPNHPNHLGRLQNEVAGAISMDEMLHTVAVAVKQFREA